jgi:hypothetical protein
MKQEDLDALVARALPIARKLQEIIGDTRREHLPLNDDTLMKIAAVAAVLKQVNFVSQDIPDLAGKAAWKDNVDQLAEALVWALANQVSQNAN